MCTAHSIKWVGAVFWRGHEITAPPAYAAPPGAINFNERVEGAENVYRHCRAI